MKKVEVALAIIKSVVSDNEDISYLLAWRDDKKHQGGCFEFVGGKIEIGESAEEALIRECREELSIEILNPIYMKVITHSYPEVEVNLHVFLVTNFTGIPKGAEGQKIQWVSSDELKNIKMPAANEPIKRMALLNQEYYITQQIDSFGNAQQWLSYYQKQLTKNAMVYLRDKTLNHSDYVNSIELLKKSRSDLKLIAHYQHKNKFTNENIACVDGFHLTHAELLSVSNIRKDNENNMLLYLGSCHDDESLIRAENLGLDAVTLSPISSTSSHPKAMPIGWQAFSDMASKTNFPVFALGGMKLLDINIAINHDAFGIAGISMLEKDNSLFKV